MGWLDSSSNGILGYRSCMTEEQVEMLRKQIAAFAAICEMLVDMYTRIIPQQDPLLALQGVRYGNLYSDPYASSSHKITTRQRWTPTPMQLQILEKYFSEGIGTPSKHKIQEITSELAQHGQITEMNVYNWFQNRRARSKRKRQSSVQQNKMESEAATKVGGQQAKKAKSSVSPSCDNAITRSDGILLETSAISSNLRPAYYMDGPSMVLSDDESEMIAQSSLFNNMITNQGTVTEGNFDFSEAEHYY